MLKKVVITYSVKYTAEVVVQGFDDHIVAIAERAGEEVDIPSGGKHNSEYVDDSFELLDWEIEDV